MNEQTRAEEHLQVIRRLMERATIYRAISAPTALTGGLLSLLASTVYWAWTRSGGHTRGFLTLWVLVLFLTSAANMLFICLGAVRRGDPIFSASMKAALWALVPGLLGGGAMTLPFLGREDAMATMFLAGSWTVFYGVALLATSHFAPRSLQLLGIAFLATGIAELAALRLDLQKPFFPWSADPATFCMAATFGLYHLVYAVCAWPRREAPER